MNPTTILRPLQESDLERLTQLANNRKVSINLRDGFPFPYSIEDAKRFKSMVDGHATLKLFAIEYCGEYVGNISLSVCADVYRKSAEIGYFIGEPYWNKGIVTCAVKLMTEWGFNNLDIVRIYAGVFEFNKASGRVLEKCGFVKEAVLKKAICKEEKMYDEIVYAKLKQTHQHLSDSTQIL